MHSVSTKGGGVNAWVCVRAEWDLLLLVLSRTDHLLLLLVLSCADHLLLLDITPRAAYSLHAHNAHHLTSRRWSVRDKTRSRRRWSVRDKTKKKKVVRAG